MNRALVITIKFTLFFTLQMCYLQSGFAQTLGGTAAYNFLNLPNTPQLSALGGINISNFNSDVGLSFNNPALLRPEMNQQLELSFNNLYAGIKNFQGMYAGRFEKWASNWSVGVHYLDYGNITQTDASGNISGNFRPTDYVGQVSLSRKYAQKWFYGASLKYIHSSYGIYRSAAIAMDIGVNYFDSSRLFQVSLLLRNMGTQVRQYQGARADDLPFDIELGFTKRLAKAPFQFSITAHHLHQFNLKYNDSSFNAANGIENGNTKPLSFDNIFRHFIVAGQFFIGSKMEGSIAYNYLIRKELTITNSSNGLTGFSFGLGVLFRKIQIRYAHSLYQNNTGYNQVGINIPFKEY